MSTILLQSLTIASVGIISPGSVTLVILLLMSERGWRNGLAYMFGYLGMYTLIGITVLTVGVQTANNTNDDQSLITSIILIVLSALLLMLAVRNWRKPPSNNDQSSRFSKILDTITPIKAFGFAAAVAVVNFKNLAIFLTAVSVLLLSNLILTTKLLILIPVVLIFCTSVIIPVLIYLLLPEKAETYLHRIKQTIDAYSRPLGIIVPLIIGLLLLSRGVSGL